MRRSAQRPAGQQEPKPRGYVGLLVDRVYGPFTVGKLLSFVGVWVYNIAAAVLAFQMTGSALVVGLVSVAQFTPQLVFAPWSGALADRGDRARQIALGRTIVTLGSGGLAVWIGLVGVEGLPGVYPLLVSAAVVGVGSVVGGPAMNALTPTLVRPDELGPAMGLNYAPGTIARAAGPALGALVGSTAGPAYAFGMAAVGNALFVIIVMLLPLSGRTKQVEGADRRVRAGVRHLRSDPTLIWLLAGVAAVSIGADPAITLTPTISHELGRATDLVGVLASAFGVGALVAFPLMSLVRRPLGESRLAMLGLLLLAGGMLALTVVSVPWLAIVVLGVAGTGMMTAITSLGTEIQVRLPDFIRGRIMALWSVAFLGSRPLASALNGAVADVVSVDAALIVVSGVVLVAAWLCQPSRLTPAHVVGSGPAEIGRPTDLDAS